MMTNNLQKLARLIQLERETLLANWREQVRRLPSAEHLAIPVLNDHVPALLDELVTALETGSDQTIPEAVIEGSPPAHGLQRLQEAFDIQEVVAEYNILRGCIHDLAEKNQLNLQGEPFHVLNRVLDQAIGIAVAGLYNSTGARSAEAARRISGLCGARPAHAFERHFSCDECTGVDVCGSKPAQ
jgi:two-component system phosphate regulon sensor histidine kinase PhoR